MIYSVKEIIKKFLPPIIVSIYRSQSKYGFFGDYSSWEIAKNESTGYESAVILERVKNSLIKVKNGSVPYARDGVVFDELFYPFPLLTAFLQIAIENDNKLNLIDFGGSLGNSYYQCRNSLSMLEDLTWNIVEQENFVRCGKENFENNQLKFFYDIESCVAVEQPNSIFMSGVIQCLESPYDFLQEVFDYSFKYIILDRVPFTKQGGDRLTVQKVPPEIYSASYPAWFFDFNKFLSLFAEKYDLVFEFDSFDKVNLPSYFKGFFFRKKI